VTRRIPEGLAEMQAGTWAGWSPMAHLGGRLAGRRLGILGMGRIGQAVARRARAFGMQIHYHNRKRLLPEVEALKGCEQPPDFHPEGDVFVHTRLMLSLLPEQVSTPLVFSVLFHDIGKPPTFLIDETGRIRFNGHESISASMTEKIFARLRFSNAETEATVVGVKNHMAFKDVQNMRVATLKRFLARPTIEDELELHRVDCQGSHGLLDNYDFLLRKREEFSNEPLIPPPLITGRDLIAAGLQPGPPFKKLLDSAQALQLEGGLKTRDDALAWLKEELARPA
jgi:poly(A) polymerase